MQTQIRVEKDHEQASINCATGPGIILIDPHMCLLLVQFPAICYRNDEEPDVHCTVSTGSGETHSTIKQYHLEAEVNLFAASENTRAGR